MKAFPFIIESEKVAEPGMDLRDYFAGQALQGYCSNSEHIRNCTIQMTAEGAYEIADAMMKARSE
jgi:hypothetical protein